MSTKGHRARESARDIATPRCTLLRLVACAVVAGHSILPINASRGDTSLIAYYTGEYLANVQGGLRTGSAYLSDAGLVVAADLNGKFGDADARIFGYVLWNNSGTFSDRYAGDAQLVSNIEAGQAVRIYEFWYEQSLNEDVSLRFGLYDLNAEFDVIGTAGLFVNSSHGIGAEYGQSGRAGPSIFPVTSLAARFELAINPRNTLRYALLDGVPGDPNDPARTRIDLGGEDGVLHALEYNYAADGGMRIGVGGWMYSADFNRIEATASQPRGDGNRGMYGFVEAPVYYSNTGAAVRAFMRYGIASDDFNAFDSYAGAGAVATGLFRSRPDDQFGLAIASARVGDPFNRQMGGVDQHETSIELTYSTQINNWLRIQPDIQWILNPGADPDLQNALVLGLRFTLAADRRISR